MSVLNQETKHDVEIIIADDSSPDSTKIIVEDLIQNHENGHWIKYHRHDNNKGMIDNFVWALQQCKGKYIALCEGDDYWTDPLKLQKQIDFMEQNKKYSICFHTVRIKLEKEDEIVDDFLTRNVNETSNIYELAKQNFIHTPSVLFRNELEGYPEQFLEAPIGDYILYMFLLRNGNLIKKIEKAMAVYRVHDKGMWSNKDKTPSIIQYLDILVKYFENKDKKVMKILKERKEKITRGQKLHFKVIRKFRNLLK